MKEVPAISTGVPIHQPERTRVEISDPADAAEFLEDTYGVNLRLFRKQAEQREGALLTHERISVGPLTIDEVFVAGELEARADPLDKVVAVWVSNGRLSGTCDELHYEARPGDIALVSQPHLPFSSCSVDLRATAVLLDPAFVAAVATGLPSTEAPLPLHFPSLLPVVPGAAPMWKSTATFVKDSVLANEAIATPLVLGNASRMLAAVTLSTFSTSAPTGPHAFDRTDHKPVLLCRAMEFMDVNVKNDIGLAEIAEAVHVTPRAVQYMFQRHLETTPLQYLRRLRLHYAHQELLTADRMSETVSGIAARWGFAHTGRFAVLYRQTYGQSPHTTLRG